MKVHIDIYKMCSTGRSVQYATYLVFQTPDPKELWGKENYGQQWTGRSRSDANRGSTFQPHLGNIMFPEMATSNTPTNLRQHYPSVSITCSSLKYTGVQVVLPMVSKQPLSTDSEREKEITNSTGVYCCGYGTILI